MSTARHSVEPAHTRSRYAITLITATVLGMAALVVVLVTSFDHHASHRASQPPAAAFAPTTATSAQTTTGTSVGGVAPQAASSRPALTGVPLSLAPVTYVVRVGDNLTVIAAWFHMQGYGQLYDLNKAVLGDNPNLIHPGQQITIANGTMTTTG